MKNQLLLEQIFLIVVRNNFGIELIICLFLGIVIWNDANHNGEFLKD